MYELLKKLFPICRSITGDGVRETLSVLNKYIPIKIYEVPTGTKAFDWIVPKEWNIRDAYIKNEQGRKIVDFSQSNLHVVNYSIPINKTVCLSELQEHLYSLENQPDAIPYITSYYEKRWGFSIKHKDRLALTEGKYHVFIDSELKDGSLTYGEYIIPGKSSKEVLLSTYICHPSLANNELSGPVVTTFIAKWLSSKPRKFTYRILFVPETIGAIVYLSKHLNELKENVIAGFNITSIGDERAYSMIESRYGNTYADKVCSNVLNFATPDFTKYSYLDRGSDERQYCSPGVDLPMVSICRSKFNTYPEYHTSLDNLDFVTPAGLKGGYQVIKKCIDVVEHNKIYKVTCYGEPQLGKRHLYPNIGRNDGAISVKSICDFIAYADGTNDLIDISNIIGEPVWNLYSIANKLIKSKLIVEVNKYNQYPKR